MNYKSLKAKIGLMMVMGMVASPLGAMAADMTDTGVVTSMGKDSQNITYENYNAHNNWYIYGHDSKNPTTIQGGTITVNHAGRWGYNNGYGSDIMLVTDSDGIEVTDSAQVHQVLNNLAGKLTYTAYTEGERNLNASAMIAEGITSSSYITQQKSYASVRFDESTGKGYTSNPSVVMNKDSKDMTINHFQEYKQEYLYSHDASDPTKILGGNIDIKTASNVVTSSTTTTNPQTTRSILILKTDSNGVDVNDAAAVKNVLNALASKVTYEDVAKNPYTITAYAMLSEGLTSSWLDAYGTIGFDRTTGVGSVSQATMNHVYRSILTGDAEKDAAEYGSNNYQLGKYGANGYYFSVKLQPKAETAEKDGVLAVIQPAAGKDLTIGMVGGSSNPLMTSSTILDVSDLKAPNGKVYAIYNNGGGALATGSTEGALQITGNNDQYVGAFYAANPEGETKSTINTAMNVVINAPKDGFVAVEAGKNGEISISKSSGTLAINSNGHTIDAIVADDGGVVNIGKENNNRAFAVTIDAGEGGRALYAKDGGTINLFNQSMYLYNMVGDVVSEGSGKISTVSLKNGTWKGNLNANTNVEMDGETWIGDVQNDKASVSLGSASTWTGKLIDGATLGLSLSTWNDTNKGDTTIGTLNGAMMRGLRGIINKESGNLTINNYSGDAVIGYTHEASNPTKITGANVTIKKAAEGSAIALRTDSNGIDLDNATQVKNVFNALAEKLTYSGYTDGENNLNATVEIAEGLTAGSRAERISKLAFDKTTGKANTTGTIASAYNAPITGDLAKDTAYAAIAKADGNTTTYTFTGDTYINNTINIKGATGDPSNMKYGITVNPDANKTVVLDLQGHDLTIENNIGQGQMAQSTTSIIYALNDGSNVYIKNPGKMDLSTFSAGYYAGGIDAGSRYSKSDNPSELIIENAADWDHAVKIRGVMGMGGASSGSIFNVNWTTIKIFNHGHVNVKGLADLYAYGAWNTSAIGDDGWINIGGGKIISESYASNDAYSRGTVWLNASASDGIMSSATVASGSSMFGDDRQMIAGKNVLQVGGNLQGSGQWVGAGAGGYINAAFTTSDSWFDGIAAARGGWISVALQNGAQWTNRDGGFKYGSEATFNSASESTVDWFYGGSSAKDTGYITQGQDGDLTFNNYKGYTTIFYNRDADDVTKVNGGYTVVKKAIQTDGKNAEIVLRTDSNGLDMTNDTQVSKVLNHLANKLIYDGYTKGEKNLDGYAQIAEGLTASSYQKQMGIIFDENSGVGRVTKDPLGQTSTLFTSAITGVESTDKEYKRAGVLVKGVYNFTEASVIQPTGSSSGVKGPITIVSDTGNANTPAVKKVVEINAAHGLKLDNTKMSGMNGYGIYASKGSQLTINGDISMEQANTYSNGTQYGISSIMESYWSPAKEATNVTINGDVDIHIDNAITDGSKMPYMDSARNEKVIGIRNTGEEGSAITVNGLVNIDVDGTGVVVDNCLDAKSVVNIKGGKIVARPVEVLESWNSKETAALNNHALAAYAGTINMGVLPEEVQTQDADSTPAMKLTKSDVEVEGNVFTIKDALTSTASRNLTDGTINMALATAYSSWKGVADNAGADKLGTFNLYLQNGGLWTNEKQGSTYSNDPENASTKALAGEWDGISHVTNLTGGEDEGHRGMISQTEDIPISIDNYSGHVAAFYGHSTTDPTKIMGGTITIGKAAEGSNLSLVTDRDGIDIDNKDQVTSVLSELAKKLVYTGAANGEKNLTANAVIGEGLTSPWAAYQLGDVDFDETTGEGKLDVDSVKQNTADTNPIYKGQYETLIMSGAKSAMASSAMLWRSGLRDMSQRLGDLHDAKVASGIWANVYGGQSQMDRDNAFYKTSYHTYQAGYDKDLSAGWRVGAGISYTDGDGKYVLGGEGDLKNTLFSLYATRIADNGSYLDIVAKGGKVKNEYTVYNEMKHFVKGDYDTTGYGLSVEYGKRIKSDSGFYIEPQAQLAWGRLNSADFTATSDMVDGKGNARTMGVSQDAFNSFVGRIGVGAGKVFKSGSSFYAKASLLHEFQGSFKSAFDAEEAKKTELDLGGSWMNFQIGGSVKLANDSYFYGSYSRNFGNNDAADDWNINVGVRYSF